MSPSIFTVVPTGVGIIDHSRYVAKSVETASSTEQVQVAGAFGGLVPSIPYPFVYWSTLALSREDGSIPAGYSISGFNETTTGDTNGISVVGAFIYSRQNYDFATDTISGPPDDVIFLKYAPRTSEVNALKGFDLRNYAGKYLVAIFNHYSVNPFVSLTWNLYGIVDAALVRGNVLINVQ